MGKATDGTEDDIEIISLVFNLFNDVNNTNHATVHDPYVIGTIFPNINEAREALLQWTVAKELSYRQKISGPRKYVAKPLSGTPAVGK